MSFDYILHGLKLRSAIELPELPVVSPVDGAAEQADISISWGTVPVSLDLPWRWAEEGYQVQPDTILFKIPGVGRFLIRRGSEIIVDQERGVEASTLRLYLIGSALGAAFHQRRLFPLHASAFELKGRCIAFLGDSGAGKSTLAALLLQRGFRLVSDDVLIVKDVAGKPVATSGVPVLKLYPQSIHATGLDRHQGVIDTADSIKRRIAWLSAFEGDDVPLTGLYRLRWLLPASAASEIAPLPLFDAMLVLRQNIFRQTLIEPLEAEQGYLDFAARLLTNAPLYEFRRAMNLANSAAQVDHLLAHINDN